MGKKVLSCFLASRLHFPLNRASDKRGKYEKLVSVSMILCAVLFFFLCVCFFNCGLACFRITAKATAPPARHFRRLVAAALSAAVAAACANLRDRVLWRSLVAADVAAVAAVSATAVAAADVAASALCATTQRVC